MKVNLLPAEADAIRRRGTASAEAYNLYLQARAVYVSGNQGDLSRDRRIQALTNQALDIDPHYARAWALLACSQAWMHDTFGPIEGEEDGAVAAERALTLDPNLAEAHAVRAKRLFSRGRSDDASTPWPRRSASIPASMRSTRRPD